MSPPARTLAATLLIACAAAPAADRAPPGNVHAAGGVVRPAGTVAGDFVAAGGQVLIDQTIGSDALLAGGSVQVRAPVRDDLRAAGGDVSIEGPVGNELFAMGGNVVLAPSGSVGRSANLLGAHVVVDGRVAGDLLARGHTVRLNGEVEGNVQVAASQLELGPQARIRGELRYASSEPLRRAEGATVNGAIVSDLEGAAHRAAHPGRRMPGAGLPWVAGVPTLLALLGFAAVLLLLAPRFGERSAARIRVAPWQSFGVGLLVLLAVPLAVMLLVMTILGIPLAAIVMVLYPVLPLLGLLVGVLFVARLLPRVLRRPDPQAFAPMLGYVALALLALVLVGWLPVVGGLLLVLLALAGLGAAVIELRPRGGQPLAGPG